MSVRAFVLIETEVGRALEVVGHVRDIPGIVSAEDVTGPYDVIAQAVANTVDELGRLVICRLQLIEGITKTLTCPVIDV